VNSQSRTSHARLQGFHRPGGVAVVVAVLAAINTGTAAPHAAGFVEVSQAHKTAAERQAGVAPAPGLRLADDAPPAAFLELARSLVQAHRTEVAREALERAQTRLLDDRATALPSRSVAVERALLDVGVARRALATGDRASSLYAIDDALAALTITANVEPSTSASGPPAVPVPMPPLVAVIVPPPPPPVRLFVLLPGRWQLEGARYVWVKGDDAVRPVAPRPFVPGHYVWRDRAWVWVPDHYEQRGTRRHAG